MQRIIPVLLRIIGLALIVVGLVAAYYGPLEIFVFYLFSEGGLFYYPGFGFGSFWFAALVVQNIGYYVIAALFIPVGIGHLKLRRWALTLTRLYIWFWLGAGLLLAGNFMALIPAVLRLDLDRQVLFSQLAVVGVSLFVLMILLPLLALGFYKSQKVEAVFKGRDARRYWTERYPLPLLALLLLLVIMMVVLHVAVFFQGLFPMFGPIMLGRPSAYVIALCILVLGVLIYGLTLLKKWAWWGSLIYVSLLTISSVMSFSGPSFYDIILMMNLPAYEMEFIDKMIPLHDYRLVGLVAVPLLAAWGLIVYARRYFFTAGQSD